jgi:hypothetical protein
MLEGMQFYLDASNLLDEDPPFVTAAGVLASCACSPPRTGRLTATIPVGSAQR